MRKILYLIVVASMLLVQAEDQEFYLSPQNSSIDVSESADVEVVADATGLQGGQIELIYNPGCIDVIDYTNASDLWG